MLKQIMLPIAIFFIFTNISHANPASHNVNEGESLWTIGLDYGASMEDIKELNGKSSDRVHPGEQLEIPTTLTAEEEELLARLIHSEAKGEPYAGKVAVGTVVLNRVADDQFPDSVYEVIHEVTPSGHYAFSPVLDGTIHQAADDESMQAARESIVFAGRGENSLFFYNPEIATNHWNATREQTKVIGDHIFSR